MPAEVMNNLSEEVDRNESAEEEEIDPNAHAKLIDGINSLTGSHFIREVTRTEPSLKRSEFGLAKSKNEKVRLGDLVKFFTKSKKHTAVVKQLDQLKERQPLQQPLEKPAADRIERKAGFERVQKDLDRWEPVITATEVAPQTVYPLLYGGTRVHDAPPKKLSEYRVKTKLMEELEELERTYEGPEGDEDENSDDPSQNYELTLEEMREKQRERARQKLRESYAIAKGRRMNKIKSKKYHRLQKKDKLKEQMKKFEELKEKNPEEALRQLDGIAKQRFQERVSLRHKNTGTWAKNLQVRAKYDTEVRRELAEQLAIGRELTARRLQQDGDSSSESDVEMDLTMGSKSGANPWMESASSHEQVANNERKLSSGYRKYWEERNQIEQIKRQIDAGDKELVGKDEGNGHHAEGLDSNQEDDNTVEQSKPKSAGKRIKKRKEKIVMASGSWNVEDIEVEETKKDKSSVSKKKGKRKRKDNVASVEEMFEEAEELIQDVLNHKLEFVRATLKEEENEKKASEEAHKFHQAKDNLKDLSFKKKARLADADVAMHETAEGAEMEQPNALAALEKAKIPIGSTTTSSIQAPVEINVKQVVQMKPKHLLTALPSTIVSGELSDDEEADDAHRLTIAEAFEDDDIVADFAKEKQDEREKDIPQEVELSLPGWGHWAGAGIKPKTNLKNARKLFKPPPTVTRRDDNRDQVIINEDGLKNEKLSKHLVNEVPFPFATVKDYEASLRAPIGRTFIPETAHATMIEPRVVTKQGALIEPMKKELLLENPAKLTRVAKRQRNEAVDEYNNYIQKHHRKLTFVCRCNKE